MQNHGTTEMVVCCRIQNYQVLNNQLTLRNAICIQPLTSQQVDSYFDQAGDQLSALKTVLPQDEVLRELATSPLMLSVMSLTYQDFTPEQLTLGGKTEDYRQRLFTTYVDRMFQRRGMTQQYPRKEARWWMIWLSQQMISKAQTMFLIERLQPSSLASSKKYAQFFIKSYFICVLVYLLSILFFGLVFNQDIMLLLLTNVIHNPRYFITIFIGMLVCLWSRFTGKIKPTEVLKWSCKNYILNWQERHDFIRAIINSVSYRIEYLKQQNDSSSLNQIANIERRNPGFSKQLESFHKRKTTNYPEYSADQWPVMQWPIMLLCLLLFLILGGFRSSEIQIIAKPNQGILRSATNATIVGIFTFVISGLIAILILWLVVGLRYEPFFIVRSGLLLGLNFGLISGLFFGGTACIQHFVLRFMLYHSKYAPWNYTRFLDYATERLFLQKVGGGYIFVHRMLMEHFAGMSPEQEDR
jgi:hypothetical protein